MSGGILDTELTYLSGVGERRAKVLAKELGLHTYRDLLHFFPYKHIDRTRIYQISDIRPEMPYVQLRGELYRLAVEGTGRKKRLKGLFSDGTGHIELVWFNGISYIQRTLQLHKPIVVFGKPTYFGGSYSISHPDLEEPDTPSSSVGILYPMYTVTERMKRAGITSKEIALMVRLILGRAEIALGQETLPNYVVQHYQMPDRYTTIRAMHLPRSIDELSRATLRLKAEELFYLRLRMRYYLIQRQRTQQGYLFEQVGERFVRLYREVLPYDLTGAQKRVLREIREDTRSGHQMNRLLQGDVGSGKTVVALLTMLLAVDNGRSAVIMAPTEILAEQHYQTIRSLVEPIGVSCQLLTGSMKPKAKKQVLEQLERGEVDILVGTHILIQEYVKLENTGVVVIDEQHRFGVYQRSVMWHKSGSVQPHILVMSATPIPRTLAMTMYGDLDVSVLDELPPGRTPIETYHYYEQKRGEVYLFMHDQIALGRQCYVVFPMIEERDSMDLKSLESGLDDFRIAFPYCRVEMVHGKMKPEEKEAVMRSFVSGETAILLATTVIEVGVNVPNASVMVIRNAERFGLAQLHQLRGRVGRGSEKSYCVLMTGDSIGATALRRIEIMCATTDGFEIAEEDLKIRGQGDIEGTQQSGDSALLKLADLSKDARILIFVSRLIDHILEQDPDLSDPRHEIIRRELAKLLNHDEDWGRIS